MRIGCGVMLVSYEGAQIDERISVVALSESEWKLCDSTAPSSDAASLLAFVEKDADGYCLLDLTHLPGTWSTFDCLAAAIAFISTRTSNQELPARNCR